MKRINWEVDEKHHEKDIQTQQDYIQDRVLLREGIATAHHRVRMPTTVRCGDQGVS